MTDQADVAHRTLALLRKVDQRTLRMAEDLHDLKVRMSSVEANLASLNRRMDRFEERSSASGAVSSIRPPVSCGTKTRRDPRPRLR